jgi:hypothetical protein
VERLDSTYYSPAMASPPPPSERRRPRPGSLARPVNGRLYRGTWLLVALPLLVTAFTVARPGPLLAPPLPPVFDGATALQLAQDLSRSHPQRQPGSEGGRRAKAWVRDQLAPYGFAVQEDRWEEDVPGLGRVTLVNLTAVAPGRSNQAIVVLAHRDNAGTGPGANDNASGTGALIELARSYATTASAAAGSVGTANTIVFLSTDAGAYGGLGAAHFAAHSPYRDRTVAVVNLVALAGPESARIEIAGDRPRSPSAPLVRTAAARVLEQTGEELRRPSALAQLVDLGFPFTLYEQGPFIGRGISAITLTTAGPRPPSSFTDTPERLNKTRLTQLGRSSQALLGSLDQGLELTQGTQPYVFLGSRFVRGWSIELSLVAALLPFLFAAVDLFAHCRRRHVRIAPALRSLRSRLGFWLWIALLFIVFSVVAGWGDGPPRPLSPESPIATSWPKVSLIAFGLLALAGWLVARDRLTLRRRVITPEEELAGHTAALLALAVVALLVVATNPFALIFVLPSLHAWLWLPQVQTRQLWVRGLVLAAGFTGPLLLLASFASRFDLGLDAPWYIVKLTAVGYVEPPALLIACGWFAATAQLAALTARRYAPYPAPRERPPRGPIREVVRRLLLLVVHRRERPARRAAVGS